jgi:hypothetical protein
MHKKEKVNFLFTSHMGYGYHGDEKKIGTNMPLLCIVTLRDFKSEVAYKKENELKMAPTSTKEVITETKPKDSLTP